MNEIGIYRVLRIYGREIMMLEACFRMIAVIKTRRGVAQAVKDLVGFTDLSIAAGLFCDDQDSGEDKHLDYPTASWLVTNDVLFPPVEGAAK